MIFAQIKNNVIVNTIVLNDESIADLFKDDYDNILRIDTVYPQPGIGWSFDGIIFNPPIIEDTTIEEG